MVDSLVYKKVVMTAVLKVESKAGTKVSHWAAGSVRSMAELKDG